MVFFTIFVLILADNKSIDSLHDLTQCLAFYLTLLEKSSNYRDRYFNADELAKATAERLNDLDRARMAVPPTDRQIRRYVNTISEASVSVEAQHFEGFYFLHKLGYTKFFRHEKQFAPIEGETLTINIEVDEAMEQTLPLIHSLPYRYRVSPVRDEYGYSRHRLVLLPIWLEECPPLTWPLGVDIRNLQYDKLVRFEVLARHDVWDQELDEWELELDKKMATGERIGLATIIERLGIGTPKAHRLFLQLKAKGKIYSAYRKKTSD